MEESARLLCPVCDLVYRPKRVVPGKIYTCRQCGGPLESMPDGPAEGETIIPAPPAAFVPPPPPAITLPAAAAFPDLSDQVRRLEDASRLLHGTAGGLEENAAAREERLAEQIRELGARITELANSLDPARFDSLADVVRQTGDRVVERLDSHRGELGAELAALKAETPHSIVAEEPSGAPAVPVAAAAPLDVDQIVNRIVGGLNRTVPRFDPESGSVVDALARVADELVREQSANTSRLDRLADDIRSATSRLGDWQGSLPDRVADEIGRTVEDRVVGPVSSALSRQAPAILSELQDNKLVDIVSRSVREAQRPLLREILAGGRAGVPVWLFAAVLLPLLLILGYLFLPGDNSAADADYRARVESELVAVTDSLHRLEAGGVPLTQDAGDRMKAIEEVVTDLHGEALNHARNAAALEEEVKGLRETLGERDRLIKEYSEMLQKQVKRLRAYETRLTRLGVSPDSVEE